MAELITNLGTFLSTRATEALQEGAASLYDCPAGAWSARYRQEAEKYIAGGHYISQASEDGTMYVAMRQDIESLPP